MKLFDIRPGVKPQGDPKTKKEPKPFKPKTFGKDIYTVYIDGCSKGNPGAAAFAGVIFNGDGKEGTRELLKQLGLPLTMLQSILL